MAVESSDAGSEWMGEADSLMRDMEIMIAERVPEDHAEDMRQEHLALDEMPLFAMLEGETM